MKKIELSEHRTTFEIEIILNTIKVVFKVTALNDIGTLMIQTNQLCLRVKFVLSSVSCSV